MDDAHGVHRCNARRDLAQSEQGDFRQGCAAGDVRAQGGAEHQRGDQIGAELVIDAVAQQGDDVGVADPGQHVDFAHEPVAGGRIVQLRLGAEQLDGHRPAGTVAATVDLGQPAAGDALAEPVGAYLHVGSMTHLV